VHHAIADTIEGWADALHLLMRSHWERFKVEFNYSSVRPRGSQLLTSGGKAPGHLPLKSALLEVEAVLAGASGRQLRPVEIYDICMFAARSVLSGGIRRSATSRRRVRTKPSPGRCALRTHPPSISTRRTKSRDGSTR